MFVNCLTVTALSCLGAYSDERLGLSSVIVSSLYQCVHGFLKFNIFDMIFYINYIQGLCQSGSLRSVAYREVSRIVSSGMLRRVALVRTGVSEELTRVTQRNIPEDTILHSHRCENLKYCIQRGIVRKESEIHTYSLGRDHLYTGYTMRGVGRNLVALWLPYRCFALCRNYAFSLEEKGANQSD
jgi:hypothetical protein